MKNNIRLKYNNTTPSSFNNYLLKCVQHVPDVFSTENLSIHYKILIGLKHQFDLHKLRQFFNENKSCTLGLIFLLICFGNGSKNIYSEDLRGRISCKTFPVKWI